MTDVARSFAPAALPAVLAATTLSGTVVIACMMPFAAIATIAALAMERRQGVAAVLACWLGNQVLGFGVLGFPRDAATVAAGLSLLGASLLAFAAVRALKGRGGPLLAFAAGFATFEASLFAYALVLGNVAMFAPGIVGLVALNDMLWFAGLWLGWQVLARMPAITARTAR